MHKEPGFDILFGIGGRPLDARLPELLRQVRELGSLAAAAGKTGLSYRHAWGELGRITAVLGGPLVEFKRGRGATLTSAGEALLDLQQSLDATLVAGWPVLAKAIAQAHPAKTTAVRSTLRIHASHDFALAALRDLAVGQGLDIELHFQGSTDALQTLVDEKCDIAGFHIAVEPPIAAGLGPLAAMLRGRALRVFEVATRRQGLMMPRGKSPRLQRLAELTRAGVRFVNRQAGSGTRLLFDRLLAAESIKAADIRGYRDEEFTHAAVAATIASGKANAGFGIQAAAHAQGLDFVPFAIERYLLVARTATLARPAAREFCELLDNPEFARVLAGLPGYAPPTSHAPRRVAEALSEIPA